MSEEPWKFFSYTAWSESDLFPARPISGIFFLQASISCNYDFTSQNWFVDSGSLPRLYGEFMHAKLKIMVS